ncbi:MAG: DMT family transporter [Thermoleophilia bacterium]
MSSPVASASLPTDRRLLGYAEIGGASLVLGTSATLIQISTMPASLLLVLRMGLAGVVLGALFLLNGGVAEVRRSGRLGRLTLIGFVVALEMAFYFAAIRLANVTVGVALEYTAPVIVVLVAPWILHTRRQVIDMVAVAVAAGGMVLIVVPGISFAGAGVSVPGMVCGLLGGVMFAAAMMLVKSVGSEVRGSTFALFFCLGSVVLITPFAVWQTWTSGYHLTADDTWIVVVNGLVYTALCFSLYTEGIRHVRVEHAGVLGYLEPVTAPLWALLLISERPPWTSLAGGVLIIAAGVLVVALGKGEAEPLPEPFT